MSYEKNTDGTYVDLEFTKFPAQIDSWENSEDVSSAYLDAANRYKTALANGNYATAQQILINSPRLKNMLIGAKDINELKHAVMAVERLYTEDIQSLIVNYSNEVKENAERATTAASSAMSSKEIAEQKAQEASKSLSDLLQMKDSIPDNFDDYVTTVNELSENAVMKSSPAYVKSISETDNTITVTAGDDSQVEINKGGQLPYTMKYVGSYIGTGAVSTSADSPFEIHIGEKHDAICIVTITDKSNSYYQEADVVLPFLLSGAGKYNTIISLKPLSTDSYLYLPSGVSDGVASANENTSVLGKLSSDYSNLLLYAASANVAAGEIANYKGNKYFVFGVDWNVSVTQPVSTQES